jgi:hypothetical protein
MLTKRTLLLVTTGLLIGYAAAAQTAPAPAASSSDFLTSLLMGLLALVAGAVLLTGAIIAAQLKGRGQQLTAPRPVQESAVSTSERGIPAC